MLMVPTATHHIFHVLPDDSTNASCSFQPCATFSQYVLDNNGSLPVVSNVEYHFLPGEHHVPTNMILQYLHNFTITSDKALSTVLFIYLQAYMEISNSVNFTISNVVFKTYDKQHEAYAHKSCNVMLNNYLSCKMMNITFLHYGFCCANLGGTSYLSNIVMDFTSQCYRAIYLYYEEGLQTDNHNKCTVVIDRIFMYGRWNCDNIYYFTEPAISVLLPNYNMTFIISNSRFKDMNKKLIYINSPANNAILIENCKFEDNRYKYMYDIISSMMVIKLSHINATLTISNCYFLRNHGIVIVTVEVLEYSKSKLPFNSSCVLLSTITITKFSGIENKGNLLNLHGFGLMPCKNLLFIEDLYVYWNTNYHDDFNSYLHKKFHCLRRWTFECTY